MFGNPAIASKFLAKLCKSDTPSATLSVKASNTEDPFTLQELDDVLSRKKDSSAGEANSLSHIIFRCGKYATIRNGFDMFDKFDNLTDLLSSIDV